MTAGILSAMTYGRTARRRELPLRDEVERKVIGFLEIDHIRHLPVRSLAYGLQKRVELGRALAMRPRVLMLDEPVAGMNREETEDMARFILDVQEEWGVTVLLVEHDMGMVMEISRQVVVLNFGEVIAPGPPPRSGATHAWWKRTSALKAGSRDERVHRVQSAWAAVRRRYRPRRAQLRPHLQGQRRHQLRRRRGV